MGFHEYTVVARGANTQLDPGFVSAPPATNVYLLACFAERLFKSSSISYLPCRRAASDSLYVGLPYVWSMFSDVWRRTSLVWCIRRAVDDFKHPFRHRGSISLVGPPVDVPYIGCKYSLMYILYLHIDGHVRLYPYLTMWGFGVMRVQQRIVGWFKQAFHKMFRKALSHFTHVTNT